MRLIVLNFFWDNQPHYFSVEKH